VCQVPDPLSVSFQLPLRIVGSQSDTRMRLSSLLDCQCQKCYGGNDDLVGVEEQASTGETRYVGTNVCFASLQYPLVGIRRDAMRVHSHIGPYGSGLACKCHEV
jgi:hypothetical protein